MKKKIINVIKYLIQGPFIVFYWLFSKNQKDVYKIGYKKGEHLFGYYDKSPWSDDQKNMILLRIPFSNKMPAKNSGFCSIELLNDKGAFVKDIAHCSIWNTQMGNRLQWLGPDFNNQIIYNDFINDKLVSVIKNINSNEEKVINKPVYDVGNDGRIALTLDFKRLHVHRPGYGYDVGQKEEDYKNIPIDDGIFFIDLINNKSRLILSLYELAKKENFDLRTMHSVRVNHIMINSDSTRFMFLFRFKIGQKSITRLYTSSIDGSDLFLFNTGNLVSHANWIDKDKFIVWADVKHTGQHYYLFADFNADFLKIIGKNILKEDGHPAISSDKKLLLTDTYNDLARRRSLIVFDIKNNKKIVLGKFYSPFIYSGELRCDLHPRLKKDSSKVCFDSVYEGNRQTYVINIKY